MQFVTLTRRRWTLNYYITQCTGNSISWGSDELEIKCGRENQHPERLGPQAPGWVAQENGKETLMAIKGGGLLCCSSVRSPTPSHTQPFQKIERYIFLRTMSLVFIVSSLWFCMHLHVSIQHVDICLFSSPVIKRNWIPKYVICKPFCTSRVWYKVNFEQSLSGLKTELFSLAGCHTKYNIRISVKGWRAILN